MRLMARQPSMCESHQQRAVGYFLSTDKLYDASTPAILKAVYTSHCFVGVVCVGATPKVVEMCSLLFGPTDGFPLEEVVGHELALFVAGGSVKVGRLSGEEGDEDAC